MDTASANTVSLPLMVIGCLRKPSSRSGLCVLLPPLFICGTKDAAGSVTRYNREWAQRTGLPLHWIEGAGHNSNTDAPDVVNALIEEFVEEVLADH